MAAAVVSLSTSEDEENSPESQNDRHKHCSMHIASVKHEEVDGFTQTRWNTYRTSLQRWLGLKGDWRPLVAEHEQRCVDLEVRRFLRTLRASPLTLHKVYPQTRRGEGSHVRESEK